MNGSLVAKGGAPDWAPLHGNLEGLSELAARSFASSEEATEAVLRLIADQVGARSTFLSRIATGEGRSNVLAAYNALDGCAVVPGAVLPLPQTF